MTTEKQKQANQKNAIASTGAITEKGKEIVSKNAIKHGIFSNTLILNSQEHQENEEEYQNLLTALMNSLSPQNQMEHLLVEKICVDFWRLRRVLKFESGSIFDNLNKIVNSYYSYPNKNERNPEIDKNINHKKEMIEWNTKYITYLKKGEVSFEHETWSVHDLESDITDDFFHIIDDDSSLLNSSESSKYYDKGLTFKECKAVFERNNITDKNISERLVKCLKKQNEKFKNEIDSLEQSKKKNNLAHEIHHLLSHLPQTESAEKVMKYEKSLQKSIFQNIALLKKLQECA